jgi:hypothetical protein
MWMSREEVSQACGDQGRQKQGRSWVAPGHRYIACLACRIGVVLGGASIQKWERSHAHCSFIFTCARLPPGFECLSGLQENLAAATQRCRGQKRLGRDG